jgi:hypothetical protein
MLLLLSVMLKLTLESPLEISSPHATGPGTKGKVEHCTYFHRLVVCLILCYGSFILLTFLQPSFAFFTSLTFTILAILLVMRRLFLMLPQLSRSSVVSHSMTILRTWWCVVYLCCCGISVVCAVTMVPSYAEALSVRFYVCLGLIVTSLGAFLATPELPQLASDLAQHLSLQTELSLWMTSRHRA